MFYFKLRLGACLDRKGERRMEAMCEAEGGMEGDLEAQSLNGIE